ncbi:VC0807 family protein [Streptomyces sp. NPDC098789]|uniref:VC0807 family protein n=1 Tax=Streptomyces sp. NPDC098789 TaxID=3366098 RepID=UPI003815DCE9
MSAQEAPTAQAAPPARSGSATAIGWIVTIVFNVVAPIVTYNILTGRGWTEFTALLLSSAWPVVDTVVSLAWRRHIDEFAIVTLVFLVITALVTLVGTHSARALLVKDSAVTGLFGTLCVATLLAPRPLMFYFGRKFGTDGTAAGVAHFNGLWQYPDFRRAMRWMTTVWGVAYLVEAALRVVLAYTLTTDTMVVLSPVLIYGFLVSLIFWTVRYSKRMQAEGEARAAAREAAERAVGTTA